MAIPTTIRLRSADTLEPAHRFDYRGRHRYIVTLPARGKSTPFRDPDTVVRVRDVLRDSGIQCKFDVYSYCFLPGRLVMLIRGKEDSSDMKQFLAVFRKASGDAQTQEGGHPFWSRKYLERVLRKLEENRDIARMIFDLPVREGVVRRGEEYPHMGSFVVAKTKDEIRRRSSQPSYQRRTRPGQPPRNRPR